jgi:hypothetical protein
MAIRLHISRLDRIRRARDFEELWSGLSNDEVFRLEVYYQAATGDVIVLRKEESDEKWATLREVVAALELAVSYVNRELAAVGRESLRLDDSDEDYRRWLLSFESRIDQAAGLEHSSYGRAVAKYMAGEVRRRAVGIAKGSEDRFNELILYADPVEPADSAEAEAAGQYECDTHRGGCEKCPECGRHSYCRGCRLCRVCSYPHVAVTNEEGKRFWVVAAGWYYAIQDREGGMIYDPRRVFDRYASEYRTCGLSRAERVRVVEDVGYESCVAILQHRFHMMGNPYDARELVDLHA